MVDLLLIDAGVAFGSTFAGVGVALWVEHWFSARRERREVEQRGTDLAGILRLLADAVQYDFSVLVRTNEASSPAWKVAELLELRMGAWEANRERFMELCDDAQLKTDFAVFFEELQRLLRFAQLIHDGGLSREYALNRLTGKVNDAIASARQIVGKHGMPPQRRAVGLEG